MRNEIKQSRKDNAFNICIYIIVIVLTLLVLYPVIYVISASFSNSEAVAQGKVWLLPVDFSIEAYKAVFRHKDLWIGYRNTIFYTVAGTVINVVLTMICAYPMARKDLVGRKALSMFFTFTMLFSGGMIPNYLLVKSLGMTNKVWSMLIPGAMSVYNMIVARTFIESNIPSDMLEAAKIDGCSDIRFFLQIVLPLSKAIIAVLALWYAVGHWNSYFNAFLYLTDKELYPLQIFLKEILVQSKISSDVITNAADAAEMQNMKLLLKYAVIVVSTVPMFAFYPIAQKHFVKGVMIGSVKG